MMSYVFLTAGLVVFVLGIKLLKLVPRVKGLLVGTREAVSVMRSPDLSEDEKERRIQRAALRTSGAFVDILLRSAASLVAPLVCVAIGVGAGLYGMDEAMTAAANPYFLLFLTVLAVLQMKLVR